MSFSFKSLSTVLIASALTSNLWANDQNTDSTTQQSTINIAGYDVPVVQNGLYDRYRSNPPLSVISKESPKTDLSWFETLDKTKVDIGFESYSPNFYYENSRVTAIFTADMDRLEALIPAEVKEVVQPLSIWPGRGLVALTAYSYHYCDNDSYNEFALSVITNKPGSANLGPISLIGATLSDDYWGYVVKLPVDTELARVRGVVGYNLPKWLTPMTYRETDTSIKFEIYDAETGDIDLILKTEKLDDLNSEPSLATNNFVNLNHEGKLSSGYAVARQLQHASSSDSDTVDLQLTDGSFSTFIKSLQLGKMIKYEYVPSFQLALYAPELLQERMSELQSD